MLDCDIKNGFLWDCVFANRGRELLFLQRKFNIVFKFIFNLLKYSVGVKRGFFSLLFIIGPNANSEVRLRSERDESYRLYLSL